jgi:DNA-binding transcriptional regulator YhcF (GntR family)
MREDRVIQFRLDPHSGVSMYVQIVHQVSHALRLGMLRPGDQLPTVKDVVSSLAINPNTVLKAYRELERDGLVEGRPGLGTFVLKTLGGPPPEKHAALRRSLERWMRNAFAAGMDSEALIALFETTLRDEREEGVA